MSKDQNTTQDTKVTDAVKAGKDRIDGVRAKITEAREVLGSAKNERDQLVTDAERVYVEQYSAGREAMRVELRDLDEAYAVLRAEINERYSNELSSLNEARDAAVNSANKTFDDTKEAASTIFGGNV